MSFKRTDVWLVIPAYNEGPVIRDVLTGLSSLPYQIVVIDDGSKDDTAQLVLELPVTLLTHITNLGQGAALQTGISYALQQPETRYIITFDADGQHCLEDIPALLTPLEEGQAEVTLGSRFLKKGSAENLRPIKRITLAFATLFTRLITGLKLSDTHNGLRGFTRQAATKIQITQNRMAHASEILSKIAQYKIRYQEVPVKILYTSYSLAKGQSIFNAFNILWDMLLGKTR